MDELILQDLLYIEYEKPELLRAAFSVGNPAALR
jgi:hypothetical protein